MKTCRSGRSSYALPAKQPMERISNKEVHPALARPLWISYQHRWGISEPRSIEWPRSPMKPAFRFLPLALFAYSAIAADKPFLEKQDIFPLDKEHNHASSIVQLPSGDLFVCWYRGSGERTADDVRIMAARKAKGAKEWTAPFVLADVPLFPDTNPAFFVDSKGRLWFFWQTIIANQWETALTQLRIASDPGRSGVPKWDVSEPIFLIPRNIQEKAEAIGKERPELAANPRYARLLERAKDKYFSRMGWMGRVHAFELKNGRILLPLYSDGYSWSLMAISDDAGKTWVASEPIVGVGNIQPSLVQKKDGTLVAYMRDNGPPPKRALVSESKDNGMTWTFATDSDIPNSGTGLEVIMLKDGRWLMINNDTERGRHSLALTISDDDGKTWKWKRHIELDTREKQAGSFHYPSIVQAADGTIHASYSVFMNHIPEGQPRKTIRHAHFNLAWVEEGDK